MDTDGIQTGVPREPVRRVPRWWRRISGPKARSGTIVAISAIGTLAAAGVLFDSRPGAAIVTLLVSGLGTVALLWRRRYPVAVLLVGIPVVIITSNPIPICFALMRIATVRRDRRLIVASAVVAATLTIPEFGSGQGFRWDATIVGIVGAFAFAMWGAYIGARRDLISSLEERAERAEQERELKTDQARTAERARIATEMHDVLAHKVSLIALQAGGLEVNPNAGAEVVERTAAMIRTTARQAMEDLRDVLGVLRSDQSASGAELAPQPEIADLPRLVARSNEAGVAVFLTADTNQLGALPPALGRTVFRVVQESLTNVHKHARGAATTVVVRREDRCVRISVTNRRPVAAGSLLPGSGAGLIGLRERVTVLGGTMRSGQTAEGGWSVEVVLPLAVPEADVPVDGRELLARSEKS